MKLLTKNTDYAVRALLYLARRRERFISSREISEKEKIPLPYLRRLLQKLSEEDLILTREGAWGGAKIGPGFEKLRFTSLIRMFQGKIQLIECMFRKRMCSHRKTCPLRKRIKKIEQSVIFQLDQITLGNLLRDLESNGKE
jgi:Rrf2 family cysteine metabolism transcriptional repressor